MRHMEQVLEGELSGELEHTTQGVDGLVLMVAE